MGTWPNRGASGGPCGGLQERESNTTSSPLKNRGVLFRQAGPLLQIMMI